MRSLREENGKKKTGSSGVIDVFVFVLVPVFAFVWREWLEEYGIFCTCFCIGRERFDIVTVQVHIDFTSQLGTGENLNNIKIDAKKMTNQTNTLTLTFHESI